MTLRGSAWAAPFLLAIGHSSEVHLPSTCVGQENGLHWLKLLPNEFPAIRQKCDNDYMIIDVNEDPNVVGYFSSYTTWHYALAGT